MLGNHWETFVMWTSIKAARAVMVSRAGRTIIAAAMTIGAAVAATPGQAAVEYVKVCSVDGSSESSYIPGTETCLDNNQIVGDQFAIVRALSRAAAGVAMSASLVNPFLPDHTNYAISVHWAGFDGQHALGFSGLVRLSGNLVFSAGFAAGLDRGRLTSLSERTESDSDVTVYPSESWTEIRVMGRIGLMYSW
jgi:hypothetical protein